ncbi:MAG: SCO family protein [Pseudomonadales bacterium]
MTQFILFALLIILPLGGLTTEQAASQHQAHHSSMPSWPGMSELEQLLNAQFELLNGENETVTEQDFRGQYLLLSFGFSHCKHVCPTTLQNWALMMKKLPDAKAARLQPIMITLDPERDSPAHIDQYSKLFNPTFLGLSGSLEQIAKTAENFRVSYHKVAVGDDYQINHSSLSFLIDPNGQVIDYFGFGTPSQQLAEKIAVRIP